MVSTETIGVGTPEDFKELETILSKRRINYSVYYEDYDPTPWNAVMEGSVKKLEEVLRTLDENRIYYETTMHLPAC